MADEPRLSEAIELYESLGLEVRLEPPRPVSGECTTCLEHGFDRCRMIYTRPPANANLSIIRTTYGETKECLPSDRRKC